jgi:hypothetical protein
MNRKKKQQQNHTTYIQKPYLFIFFTRRAFAHARCRVIILIVLIIIKGDLLKK